MKFSNSLGFLLIGSVMVALPRIAPGICPPDASGTSLRGLWLHVMGLTQIAIGGAFVVRKFGAELAGWLARWPELIEAPFVELKFATVRSVADRRVRDLAAGTASFPEVIPVEFKPAWSDQRAA